MINTKLSVQQKWVAGLGFNNSFTITVTNGGSAFDFSAYTFVVNIRRIGGSTNLLQLTQGSGITNGGASGIVTIQLTAAQTTTLGADSYYYSVEYTVGGLTYDLLCGTLELRAQYNPENENNAVAISVNLAGTDVNLDVSLGGDSNTRTRTTTSTATLTPNVDLYDMDVITAQAEALVIANPTGTPVNGNRYTVRVDDDGTVQNITFGDKFRAITGDLPTVTTNDEPTYINFRYNSTDDKFDVNNGVDLDGYALLESPSFTGSPTAPTQLSSDNSTKLANTIWVNNKLAAIPPESLFVDAKIQTSEGNTYDLTGLTDAQSGEQLQLAIDEASNNAGVIIFIPGGVFSRSAGFTWKKRNTALVGFSRSKTCEIESDTSDTFLFDTSYVLYNSTIVGVSFANTGGTKDAVKFAAVDGAGQTQSQIELNIHINESTRDGLHLTSDATLNACNFDIKMTTKSVPTGIDRYSIYANCGSGLNIIIRTDDAEVYLDSSSQNISLQYVNNPYIGSASKLSYTDLGANNNIFTPDSVKTTSPTFSNFFSKIPIRGIPKQYITFYYPLNDSSFALDYSEQQNDATINGSPSLYNSGIGNIIDFDGVDDYVTIPTSSTIQGVTDTFIFGIVFRIDSLAANKRIFYAGTSFELKFETTSNRITAGVNIGGSVRTRSVTDISADTTYMAVAYYDGASFILRLNQEPSSTLSVTGNVAFGSNNIDVGRISTTYLDGKAGHFVLLNTYSQQLLDSLEGHLANMVLVCNTMQRAIKNKTYEDIEYQVDDKGVVLVDRTTATKYRLYVDSGSLLIETI